MVLKASYEWKKVMYVICGLTIAIAGVLAVINLVENYLLDTVLYGSVAALAVFQILKVNNTTELGIQRNIALITTGLLVVIVAVWNVTFVDNVANSILESLYSGDILSLQITFVMQTLMYLVLVGNAWIAGMLFKLEKAQQSQIKTLELKKSSIIVENIPAVAPKLVPVISSRTEKKYYMAIDGENLGEKTLSEIELHKKNETLLLWKEGFAEWQTYQQVFGSESI